MSNEKSGPPGTRFEILFIPEILAFLCYIGNYLKVRQMTDPFKDYIQSLQTALATRNATEHTHRFALQALLEPLMVMSISKPRQEATEFVIPDMVVVLKGAVPL